MPGPNPPPSRNPGKRRGGRLNSIGLGVRELGELLDRFEAPEGASENPKRDFVRWPFREVSIPVQFCHPGGVNSWVTVACRNISRAGIAILHSAYVHTGTKCRLILPHPTKIEVAMDGWVTRCCHRAGVVHEIGVRFDQHLDVQEILRPNPMTDWYSLERVKATDLCGTVVYVEDSDIDCRILKHFLRETKLHIVTAGSGADGLKCVDASIDLVILDYHLGDMTGAEVARALRERGVTAPIILMTCDTLAAKETLTESRVNAYVGKPVDQELLLRAIGEFLIVRRAPRVQRSFAGGVTPTLTKGLVSALGQYAKKLEDCASRSDAPGARTLCMQIAGAAGTAGFKEVSELATRAAEAISRSMSVPESISAIRSLAAACKGAADRATAPDIKKPAA